MSILPPGTLISRPKKRWDTSGYEDDEIEKHLPGKHDQKTHGNGYRSVHAQTGNDSRKTDEDRATELIGQMKARQDELLDDAQKEALDDYVSPRFAEVNSALRDGRQMSIDTNITVIRGIDTAIRRSPGLDEPTAVFRSMSGRDIDWDNIKEDEVITDKGYVSTSLSYYQAASYNQSKANRIIAEIRLPKGQKFAVAAQEEWELLLPRGMSFRVMAKETFELDGKEQRRLVLEPVATDKHLPGKHDQKDHGRTKRSYKVSKVSDKDLKDWVGFTKKVKVDETKRSVGITVYHPQELLESSLEPGTNAVGMRDASGKLQAFYTWGWQRDKELFEGKTKLMQIGNMAVAPWHARDIKERVPGWGSALMYDAMKKAIKGNADVVYAWTDNYISGNFCKKIGMKWFGNLFEYRGYYFDRKGMKAYVRQYEARYGS